ncbi:MAG: hypothetical protein K9W44_07120 [Candidatus Lokiarchaeota archaeon]|nr:hypothetical protein [Candidatus Harpocratesius repetitus]
MFQCSRCGKCCIEFEGQIHFKSSESFISPNYSESSHQEIREKNQHPYITLYRKIQQKWCIFDSSTKENRYYIPSKRQIWERHPKLAENFLPYSSKKSKECLFLAWHQSSFPQSSLKTAENIPYCIIHGNHPEMCRNYPKSKGYVCKNHPERKYTIHFLHYQQKKIGFAINVLKQLYKEKVFHPFAFDLLALLMDFGDFSKKKVQNFFFSEFDISLEVWKNTIQDLLELHLISEKDQNIQGISLKETEYLIDRIMNELGWNQ